jgi:hypothetical protein
MLDEKPRRKEGFDPRNSVPVVLADGQEWYVPKPWLEVHPVFRDGKAQSSYPVLTYGPELDAIVKTLGGCDENSALLMGAASLGAHLLLQNYHLSDADLDQLFVFRIGDSLSRDWAMLVLQIATGQSGPKV